LVLTKHRFQIVVFFAICYGPIQTKISLGGVKTIVVSLSLLVQTLFLDSYRNMTWILSAELIKLWKMDMNSFPNVN
jgi:hypothetical protein